MNLYSVYETSFAMFQPTRTKILKELKEGPKTIGELSEKVRVDRSTITYHFGILGKLVKETYCDVLGKNKLEKRYSINQKAMDIAIKEINENVRELATE